MVPVIWIGAMAAALLDAFRYGIGGYLEIAQEAHRRRPDLPGPIQELDRGMAAAVYETHDPNVLLRVTHVSTLGNELELLNHDRGVVRVWGLERLGEFVITWKERVNPNVEWFLEREGQLEAARALLGLYDVSARQIRTLKRFPSTADLAEAIEDGLPTGDLDLHHNLGVTRDGKVVAYDL